MDHLELSGERGSKACWFAMTTSAAHAPPKVSSNVPASPPKLDFEKEYANTLRTAEPKNGFLVSVWLKHPGELQERTDMVYIEAPELIINNALWGQATDHHPMQVRTDPATAEFFRSRQVRYRVKFHPTTARPMIVSFLVSTPDTLPKRAVPPITLELDDFLPRYLADHKLNRT